MSNLASTPQLPELWSSICAELQRVVSPDAVGRWFRPLKPESYAKGTLTLSSDNSIYRYWIEENYLEQLKATASRVLGEPVAIAFHADEGPPAALDGVAPRPDRPKKEKESASSPASRGDSRGCLNPRFTFEAFVVGENNRFAAAAARAVAEAPMRTYNPLFLHGRVGLGKTHLMQAIGHLR